MQKIVIALAFVTAFVAIMTIMLQPTVNQVQVYAASMADTQNSGIVPNDSNSSNNSSTGNIGGPNSMTVTAIPDKPEITRGSAQSVTVKATTENGTGIPDVNIASVVVDYATGKQKVLLGGQTDDKGILVLTTQIGPHANPGQYLVSAVAEKDGFNKQTITTGFVVDAKGGSGSSSSSGSGDNTKSVDSKGNCSGSGCK